MTTTCLDYSLRPLQLSDAPSIARHLNNPRVARNLSRPPFPFTLKDARDFIARSDPSRDAGLAAIDIEGEAVGVIGYRLGEKTESRTATLGYWLAEPFWGRGIMSSAVRDLVEQLLQRPEILRIEAHVFGWNPASARVLEKVGFSLEAHLKNAVWKNGEVTGLLIYSLLK